MSRLSCWWRTRQSRRQYANLPKPSVVNVEMGHQVGYFETPTGCWWLPLSEDIVAVTMRLGNIFEPEAGLRLFFNERFQFRLILSTIFGLSLGLFVL